MSQQKRPLKSFVKTQKNLFAYKAHKGLKVTSEQI